jgi:MFS family permease
MISSTGDWIYRFAVPTLILHLTGSALATAFAYVLEFLPYIAVGPFAGVFADRFSRRRIMVSCDACSCVIAVGIAGLTQVHHVPIAALYVCALALACVRPFYFPAFQGFLVEMVGESQRPRFNSWTEATDGMLSLAGPVLGTAIVAAAGASAATALDAVSFALSATLVATIPYHFSARPGREVAGIRKDFIAGFQAITISRAILVGTILITGANLAVMIIEGNFVYLVLNVEHHSKVALGLVFSAQGIGAILGAVAAPRLLNRQRSGLLLAAAMGLSGIAMAIPVAFPLWSAILVGQCIQGCATSVTIVCWFSTLQRLIPQEVIGRFVAVGRAMAYATIPVGALLGASLLGTFGSTRILFGCAAILQFAIFLTAIRSPLVGIDREQPRPAAV